MSPGLSWVTLLTKRDYLEGVLVLRRSLERTGSRHPLTVMVTPSVFDEVRLPLEQAGCFVHQVDIVPVPGLLEPDYAWPHFAEAWTKLRVFTLRGYDRVVYLDADMLVVKNMDELFDLPLTDDRPIAAVPACVCNPRRMETYPDWWKPENCMFTYGDADSAGADFTLEYFNSGLMVLAPGLATYDQILERLGRHAEGHSFAFAEQDLLNMFFYGRWTPLSYIYNGLRTLPESHPALWRLPAVKNIHFIHKKPWQTARSTAGSTMRHDDPLDELWWAAADELALQRKHG